MHVHVYFMHGYTCTYADMNVCIHTHGHEDRRPHPFLKPLCFVSLESRNLACPRIHKLLDLFGACMCEHALSVNTHSVCRACQRATNTNTYMHA